jgi:hypothetical protein
LLNLFNRYHQFSLKQVCDSRRSRRSVGRTFCTLAHRSSCTASTIVGNVFFRRAGCPALRQAGGRPLLTRRFDTVEAI